MLHFKVSSINNYVSGFVQEWQGITTVCLFLSTNGPGESQSHPGLVKAIHCKSYNIPFICYTSTTDLSILNFSVVTAPLSSLLKGKPKTLFLNPDTHKASLQPEEKFSMAILICHPDPQLSFTIDVHASITGVGTILSQETGDPPHLQSCAYFTHSHI